MPLNEQFDVIKDNYRRVTDLKVRYPKLKVLLSVGGNEDVSGEGAEKNLKYRQVVSGFVDYRSVCLVQVVEKIMTWPGGVQKMAKSRRKFWGKIALNSNLPLQITLPNTSTSSFLYFSQFYRRNNSKITQKPRKSAH